MTTQEQRQQWSALAQAATPGEWVASFGVTWDVVVGSLKKIIVRTSGINNNTRADAAFIAAARTAVPQLLADVDALTQERDAYARNLADAQGDIAAEIAERERVAAERNALAAELARVRGDYEYIRHRAPWGAIQRLAWYGAENYNYSTDAKQVEEYVAGFHPNAQPQA